MDWQLPKETPGATSEGKHAWQGQCIDCGFLAERGIPGYEQEFNYLELTTSRRLRGQAFRQDPTGAGPGLNLTTHPVCFLHVASFLEEIKDAGGGDIPARLDVLEALAKAVFEKSDRNCPRWFLYKPGLSPQLHLQRMEIQDLEDNRRKWEQRLEDERRDFDRSLHSQSQATQTAIRSIANRQLIIGGLGVIVAVAIAAYGARANRLDNPLPVTIATPPANAATASPTP